MRGAVFGSIDSRNANGGTARSDVDQQIANTKVEVARMREFAGSAGTFADISDGSQ